MLIRVALLFVAVVLAVLLAVTHGRYYIAYAFASALVVWLTTRPPKARYLYVGLIAAVLWGIRLLCAEPDGAVPDTAAEQAFYMTAAFFGAGGLVMFALFPPPRHGTIGHLEVAGAFLASSFGLMADRWFRYMTENPLPSLDRALFALDAAALGFQPSFIAGELFSAWPPLAFVATAVYRMLPVTLAIVFVGLPAQPGLRLRFLVSTSAAGVIGYFIYRLCPAAGPAYAFPDLFPTTAPNVTPGWVQPMDMPSSLLNAFPSLHTTWALLVVAWAGRLPAVTRGLVLALAALTLLATLGLGEHYVVDLIAAVPFAVAFEMLFTPRPLGRARRVLGAAVCAAIVIVWVIAVRTGAALEADLWLLRALVAVTVVVPALLRPWARSVRPTGRPVPSESIVAEA